MFGTMFIVILSAVYIFQVTLLNRRKTSKNASVIHRQPAAALAVAVDLLASLWAEIVQEIDRVASGMKIPLL